MNTRTFTLVNLGCPKNQVDGEGIVEQLREAGLAEVRNPRLADAIIVNTCGFIDSAKQESIQALLDLASHKRPGQILVAAGCLGERYARDLARELPELDGILGTRRWSEIHGLILQAEAGQHPCWTGSGDGEVAFRRTVCAPSAYLKIADGCDAGCAFCAIPGIKGSYRSKPAELVLAEARQLARRGVKELVLVAQDTTAYGRDWRRHDALAELLQRLVDEVPEVPWLRLMYTYPAHITPRLLETIARNERIVKYVDLPLQHVNPRILRAMKRPATEPRKLIERLREAVPNIAIRSTFIVGYPGETEEEFGTLLAFLRDAALDRVGVFPYSPEEGTPAASLPDQVHPRVRRQRHRRAMEAQQEVSLEQNQSLVGKILDVLVEGNVRDFSVGRLGTNLRVTRRAPSQRPSRVSRSAAAPAPTAQGYASIGRCWRDAPEVDGVVFVREPVEMGHVVPVRITAASDYDLFGELAPAER
ncbi:MAG: 30S ribosomal protein S12 methylthiotransferase RimO [Chloroflexi bacterium]|nr:30S ribosomal protein S12 methylthiotransferase RimO [Chloroflexota bacterium]